MSTNQNTTIYIVRHGEIDNPEQVVYLRMDKEIPLSPLGEKQIKFQADKLAQENIQAIYHSPLWRTKHTAKILEKKLITNRLIPDKRLMDNLSPAQGMLLTDFDSQYGGSLYHPKLITQGGETLEDISHRMMTVVKDIHFRFPNQSVCMVSHGDPIKVLWLLADQQPLTKEYLGSDRHPIPGILYPTKGSVTVMNYDGKKLVKKDYWPAMSEEIAFIP